MGNIAPDCNIENEDWTSFTPPREVTHFMLVKGRKTHDDCCRFLHEYILERHDLSTKELSFLLGYYSHLIADVEYQEFVREESRVNNAWYRILTYSNLREKAKDMLPTWENVKCLINAQERGKNMNSLERAYLDEHPDSGFFTEIMTLNSFPHYMDFLPEDGIIRKVAIMGRIPENEVGDYPFVVISKDEYNGFIIDTSKKIIELIMKICKSCISIK